MAPPKGLPKGTTRAMVDQIAGKGPAGQVVRETHTTQTVRVESPARARLEAALVDLHDATLGLYIRTILGIAGVSSIRLKKNYAGRWTPVDELLERGTLAQTDDPETYLMQTHGPAVYRLDPILDGREIIGSRQFVIGGEPAIVRSLPGGAGHGPITDDLDKMLKERVARLSALEIINKIERGGAEGDDDMKAGELAQLIVALKHDPTTTNELIRAAEERARLAAEQMHAMTLKMLEANAAKTETASGWIGALPQLVTALSPFLSKDLVGRAAAALVGGQGEAGGWSSPEFWLKILEQFGPGVQGIMMQVVERMAQTNHATAAAAPTNGHTAQPAAMPAPDAAPDEEPSMPPKVFLDMMTALREELAKPGDDRDVRGIFAFCQTITVNPVTGESLADRFALLARSPVTLARHGVAAIDPGFLEPATFAGIAALFEYLRALPVAPDDATVGDE